MPYACPKCGSSNTEKDRRFGSDTGDRACRDCGYEGPRNEFDTDKNKSNAEAANEIMSEPQANSTKQTLIEIHARLVAGFDQRTKSRIGDTQLKEVVDILETLARVENLLNQGSDRQL